MRNLLLLSATLTCLLLTACNSEDKELEIDRQVRKKLSVIGESVITDLKLTKEQQENLYFADAMMENGLPIQAMVMITSDTVALKETLNSAIFRRLTKELRDTCVAVTLKPVENGAVENEFQGEAAFRSGAKIQLFAHEQLGWRPANDSATLHYLTKRQMERDLYGFVDTIKVFNLAKTTVDTVYAGNSETKKGDKRNFSVTWSQTGFRWELKPNLK